MNVHLTLKSANKKTGPIPVSTTSRDTCPAACPFRGAGCYAESGPLAIHWREVTAGNRGMPWRDFLRAIAALPDGQLWRHNQAGDLPGVGNRIDAVALSQLAAANRHKRGFTYTHKPMTPANRERVAQANQAGFTVNVSANSPTHADELCDAGVWPVVTVLPADVDGAVTPVVYTPAGKTISVCPATYRDDVSCATCQLCARADRKSIVGFPAHGSGARKASATAGGK